jgi:FlaG/FlaF family flagellin (archaellin)
MRLLSRKGVTPVVATTLLILITAGAATSMYTMQDNLINDASENSEAPSFDSEVELVNIMCSDREEKSDIIYFTFNLDTRGNISNVDIAVSSNEETYTLREVSWPKEGSRITVSLKTSEFDKNLDLEPGEYYSFELTGPSGKKKGGCGISDPREISGSDGDTSSDGSESSDDGSDSSNDPGESSDGVSSGDGSDGSGSGDTDGSSDSNPPETSDDYSSSAWKDNPQNVEISCSDSGSGCSSIEWRLIDNEDKIYSEDDVSKSSVSVKISKDGAQTLEYRSIDNAGNKESWNSQIVKIDTSPPHILLEDEGKWYKTDISKSTDEGSPGPSGLSKCDYRLKNKGDSWGSWMDRECGKVNISVGSSEKCSLQGKDRCLVEVRIEDNAGNSESYVTDYNIDYSKPDTNILLPNTSQTYHDDFSIMTEDREPHSNIECGIRTSSGGKWSAWKSRTCDENTSVTVSMDSGCSENGTCQVQIRSINTVGQETVDGREYNVEPQIPYNGKESIPGLIQVEDFDSGGEGVSYHDTTEANKESAYRSTGVDISDYGDRYAVGWTSGGEWLEYTTDVEPGEYDIKVEATGTNDEVIDLSLDGEKITSVNLSSTGGWNSWTTFTKENVQINKSGEKILRLYMQNGGMTIDSVEFVESTSSGSNSSGTSKQRVKEKCGDWELISHGEGDSFRIFNNKWGLPNAKQCIWQNNDSSYGYTFNSDSNENGLNYPEVFIGTRPWGEDTGVAEFPIRRRNVDEFTIDVEVNQSINGKEWDLAEEWWLMENTSRENGTYQYEVMLLLDWGPEHDHGSVKEKAAWTDKYGNTVDLWAVYQGGGGTNAPFYIFRIQDGHDGGKIDMTKIMEYMSNNTNATGDLWLSGVEVGNEYWNGTKANITYNEFDVTINGQTYESGAMRTRN